MLVKDFFNKYKAVKIEISEEKLKNVLDYLNYLSIKFNYNYYKEKDSNVYYLSFFNIIDSNFKYYNKNSFELYILENFMSDLNQTFISKKY